MNRGNTNAPNFTFPPEFHNQFQVDRRRASAMPAYETRKLRLKTSRVTTVVSEEMMALGIGVQTNTIGCTSTVQTLTGDTYAGCAADVQK
jgi:hypothetical protein